jgi:hypothetical protein
VEISCRGQVEGTTRVFAWSTVGNHVGARFESNTLAVQVISFTCLADFLAYITYCYGSQVKENEMEGSYSTHGYYENHMLYFNRKTLLGRGAYRREYYVIITIEELWSEVSD